MRPSSVPKMTQIRTKIATASQSRRVQQSQKQGARKGAPCSGIAALLAVTELKLCDCKRRDGGVICTACAGYLFLYRSHDFPLRRPGKTWGRRHGRGLQGQGHPAWPERGAEIPPRRYFPGLASDRAISTRSARGVGAESRQYLHHLRYWRVRRAAVYRHGAARGADSEAPHFREAH